MAERVRKTSRVMTDIADRENCWSVILSGSRTIVRGFQELSLKSCHQKFRISLEDGRIVVRHRVVQLGVTKPTSSTDPLSPGLFDDSPDPPADIVRPPAPPIRRSARARSIHVNRCSGRFYPPEFLSGRIEYSIPPDKISWDILSAPGIFYPQRVCALFRSK